MDAQPVKLLDQARTELVERVRNKLRLKHYAFRTEQAYVDWIKRFILFHGKKHPADQRSPASVDRAPLTVDC